MITLDVHILGAQGQDPPLPEFPVKVMFDRVPAIGEYIEFNDYKHHFHKDDWEYENILLEVKRVIWTTPNLGHRAEPTIQCAVVQR